MGEDGSLAAEPYVPELRVSGFGDCVPLSLCLSLSERLSFEDSPISSFLNQGLSLRRGLPSCTDTQHTGRLWNRN